MSGHSTDSPDCLNPSTSSVAASPARTLASPGPDLGSRANAPDYGPSSTDSLASFDLATLLWRTSQRCLFGGWAEFSETWPRAGMTRSGTAFPLSPLAPITDEIESGLWPTPKTARPIGLDGAIKEFNRRGHDNSDLRVAVHYWPRSPGTPERLSRARRESSRGQPLTEEVGGMLSPTWVEWLMGFPLGWTDCVDSATPLSRKSRSGSSGGSRKRK
jgi:hypothetical protein